MSEANRGTVFLVDDHEGVRDITGEILESKGFGVIPAESAHAALHLIASGGIDSADVALIDGLNGEGNTVAAAIRERRGANDKPAIISWSTQVGCDFADRTEWNFLKGNPIPILSAVEDVVGPAEAT